MKTTVLRDRRKMASRFKKFRAKHALTQAQLSRLISLDRTQISRIEKAHAYPYHSTIERLNAVEKRLLEGQRLRDASR